MSISQQTEAELLDGARAGDSRAFDRLMAPHLPRLRALAYRMLAHPDDADDIVQETLVVALQRLGQFRGEAALSTWLLSITTRKCLDHLRVRKRWPVSAQSQAASTAVQSPAVMGEIEARAVTPGFRYEYREHIAYCFSCLARSLEPEEEVALILREVLEHTNDEAAQIAGMSVSTFRHRLASARSKMKEAFAGLCSLVGKQGACWQCEGLRDALPSDRRGTPVQRIGTAEDTPNELYRRRLKIVRQARLGTGTTAALHDYLLQYMSDSFG